jgi:thiosulfate/3-mercaptopyruvate sulfurtransferase
MENSGVTSPLVSCADLAASLSGPQPPVLLDVRWRLGGPPGREDYGRGHLPGAVFLDLDTDLAAPPGSGGRHPLPAPADLERVLRAAGVRAGAPVVAYDADNGSIAARVWWLLRWAGHDQVRVLDGGYAAWAGEGRPVTTDVPTPEPGDVTVDAGQLPVVDADGAAALARSGVLLDARAPERYRGDVEPIDARAGHVPGAVNAPFAAHAGEDGRWRTSAELAEHFAKLGVTAPGAGAGTAGARGVAGARAAGGAAAADGDENAGGAMGGSAGGSVEGVGASEGGGGGWAGAMGGDGNGGGAGGGVMGGSGDGSGAVAGGGGVGGVAGPRVVGAYCGSGVTATSVLLALEVAGITSPAAPGVLYAGSWSEWGLDSAREVATGGEPG